MAKTRAEYEGYALSHDDYLDVIVERDTSIDAIYTERNMGVALIARMALSMGLEVGMAEDANEGEEYRSLCIISLPSGQVIWHIPQGELHLFSGLPPYRGTLDSLAEETETRQERMMNPGKLPYLGETVVCTQHGEAELFPLHTTNPTTIASPPFFRLSHPPEE